MDILYCNQVILTFYIHKKSLVQCRSSQSQQRVGVELLEASIADLNKYKLRKTQQFGSFKYDPGKYYTASSDDNNKKENGDNNGDSNTMPPATNESSSSVIVEEQVPLDKASFEDELEAPWNQYAWAEEMRLRVRQLCIHLVPSCYGK